MLETQVIRACFQCFSVPCHVFKTLKFSFTGWENVRSEYLFVSKVWRASASDPWASVSSASVLAVELRSTQLLSFLSSWEESTSPRPWPKATVPVSECVSQGTQWEIGMFLQETCFPSEMELGSVASFFRSKINKQHFITPCYASRWGCHENFKIFR